MKRTFIAVRIIPGEKLLDALSEIRSELSNERIKWEDSGKIHLTLAFIGDTSEDTIVDISGILDKICRKKDSFKIKIEGIGLFKSMHDPRIIWVGIESNHALEELQRAVVDGLVSIGVPVEDRPFKPHLTAGRIKSLKNRKSLGIIIEKYNGVKFQESVIEEVIYFESILRPEGSLYLPIRKYRLEN